MDDLDGVTSLSQEEMLRKRWRSYCEYFGFKCYQDDIFIFRLLGISVVPLIRYHLLHMRTNGIPFSYVLSV
jgi:hypothetical protein